MGKATAQVPLRRNRRPPHGGGRNAGFTLVELIVVVLIVGVLAAFAVPQYQRTVENSKAEDALAIVQMVATTNRMFRLDKGVYVTRTPNKIDNTCNTMTCAAAGTGQCALVACKYLAAQDWDAKPYDVSASPGGGCLGTFGVTSIACVVRKSGPYANWTYKVDANGGVSCEPAACGTAGAPPAP